MENLIVAETEKTVLRKEIHNIPIQLVHNGGIFVDSIKLGPFSLFYIHDTDDGRLRIMTTGELKFDHKQNEFLSKTFDSKEQLFEESVKFFKGI